MMTHAKTRFVLILLTATIAACNGRDAKKSVATESLSKTSPQANVNPKYGAPVQATATRNDDQLQIELSFAAAAQRVYYNSHGVNGVQIIGPATGELTGVAAGTRQIVSIGFVAADHPKGQVALIVSGNFNGQELSRAFSFGVANAQEAGGLKQSDDADAKAITTDSQGRKIHVLPAK